MNRQSSESPIAFMVVGIFASFLVMVLIASSPSTAQTQTEDTPTPTVDTCQPSTTPGSSTVCFNNVVIISTGKEPCPKPNSRVGLIKTCGGTLKVRAYNATPFPEEFTAAA